MSDSIKNFPRVHRVHLVILVDLTDSGVTECVIDRIRQSIRTLISKLASPNTKNVWLSIVAFGWVHGLVLAPKPVGTHQLGDLRLYPNGSGPMTNLPEALWRTYRDLETGKVDQSWQTPFVLLLTQDVETTNPRLDEAAKTLKARATLACVTFAEVTDPHHLRGFASAPDLVSVGPNPSERFLECLASCFSVPGEERARTWTIPE